MRATIVQELRLQADHMPYVVEAGRNYQTYHDLVGEIDPTKPANAGCVPMNVFCAGCCFTQGAVGVC